MVEISYNALVCPICGRAPVYSEHNGFKLTIECDCWLDPPREDDEVVWTAVFPSPSGQS